VIAAPAAIVKALAGREAAKAVPVIVPDEQAGGYVVCADPAGSESWSSIHCCPVGNKPGNMFYSNDGLGGEEWWTCRKDLNWQLVDTKCNAEPSSNQ